MTINPDILREKRKAMGFTQEELAERLGISRDQWSRIERGVSVIDLLKFLNFMELAGETAEDAWLLYMDTNEYNQYVFYKNAKKLLRDEKLEALKIEMSKLEGYGNVDVSIQQFLMVCGTILNSDMSLESREKELRLALSMSIKNFNEERTYSYRLRYNEILILNNLGYTLFVLGDKLKGIRILEDIVTSAENFRTSQDDKDHLYPTILNNLVVLYTVNGEHEKALKFAERALAYIRESGYVMVSVLSVLHSIASAKKNLGADSESVREYLVQAYYLSNILGEYKTASFLRKDALESFGVPI